MSLSKENAAEEGRLPVFSRKDMPNNRETESEKDQFLVAWNGDDDPEDPKNWTKRQKWAATFVSISPFRAISI